MDSDDPTFLQLLKGDPGQPRPDATVPYWLHKLHPLASHKSPNLPSTADVTIIGSGISGLTVARTLLMNDPSISVAVLEARTICSGATGRNGGQLVAYGGANYAHLKRAHGQAMATKIVEFTFRSIARTRAIIEESGDLVAASEFRNVTRLRTFADQDSMEDARDSIAEFVGDNPQYADMYTIVEHQKLLREKYNLHGVVGAVLFEAAALWPYRLIMEIWNQLLSTYPSRLSLEAETPVTAIAYQPNVDSQHPYVATTARGVIRASKVAYCTNGYTSNLLPNLRGALFPYRGTMSVQDLAGTDRPPNRGAEWSWSIHQQPGQDEDTGEFISTVHYLQQNAKSGYYFFGGGKEAPLKAITADDTFIPPSGVSYLQAKLPCFLGQSGLPSPELISSWTGIMGFTSDENPLVGVLPPAVTSRSGQGEYIAAGFNGMGMSLCVASGEALAHMILGHGVGGEFPEAFNVTEARLQHHLNVERSVEALKAMWPKKDNRKVSD